MRETGKLAYQRAFIRTPAKKHEHTEQNKGKKRSLMNAIAKCVFSERTRNADCSAGTTGEKGRDEKGKKRKVKKY